MIVGSRPAPWRPSPIGVALGFALTAFVALAVLVYEASPRALALSISRAVQSARWLELPMRLVSIPGNGWNPHLLTTLTVLALFILRARRESLFLALVAAGGAFINGALKRLVARPRPTELEVSKLDLVDGFSFPSGHVAFYVCYFGFLAYLAARHIDEVRLRRLALTVLTLPIALVPLSRVYLGAHFASDTLGSLLWSTTWLALVCGVYARHSTSDLDEESQSLVRRVSGSVDP